MVGVEVGADAVEQGEPLQARRGQHDAVEAVRADLADPGVDVAADLREPQVGPERQQLGAAAGAAGAEEGAFGQLFQAAVSRR